MKNDTAAILIRTAQELLAWRGYHGFSYRDLAERVGITTASIHHHFPAKADLARAAVRDHHAYIAGELRAWEGRGYNAFIRVSGYVSLLTEHREVPMGPLGARSGLSGRLMAECPSLPEGVQLAVRELVADCVSKLADMLRDGREDGSLAYDGHPEDVAAVLHSTLEGALLWARATNDAERFSSIRARLLASLASAR